MINSKIKEIIRALIKNELDLIILLMSCHHLASFQEEHIILKESVKILCQRLAWGEQTSAFIFQLLLHSKSEMQCITRDNKK